MTAKEAYNLYREHYKTNQWTGEDVLHYLKKSWIDYEEYNFEEFTDKVITDDRLNERWANGCTRELSEDEIWDYIHTNKIEILHQHAVLYGHEVGSEYRKSFIPTLKENYNIPTRTIIQ